LAACHQFSYGAQAERVPLSDEAPPVKGRPLPSGEAEPPYPLCKTVFIFVFEVWATARMGRARRRQRECDSQQKRSQAINLTPFIHLVGTSRLELLPPWMPRAFFEHKILISNNINSAARSSFCTVLSGNSPSSHQKVPTKNFLSYSLDRYPHAKSKVLLYALRLPLHSICVFLLRYFHHLPF
jgi:hypothetical protein